MKRRNFLPLLALGAIGCATHTRPPTAQSTPTVDTLTPSRTYIQNTYNTIYSLITQIEALTPRDAADTRQRLKNQDLLNEQTHSINVALLDQKDAMYRSSRFDPKQPPAVHPSHVPSFNLLYKATVKGLDAVENLIDTYNLAPQELPLSLTRRRTAEAQSYLKQALESIY